MPGVQPLTMGDLSQDFLLIGSKLDPSFNFIRGEINRAL